MAFIIVAPRTIAKSSTQWKCQAKDTEVTNEEVIMLLLKARMLTAQASYKIGQPFSKLALSYTSISNKGHKRLIPSVMVKNYTRLHQHASEAVHNLQWLRRIG